MSGSPSPLASIATDMYEYEKNMKNKNKKYHTVGIFLKSNRKILEAETNRYP